MNKSCARNALVTHLVFLFIFVTTLFVSSQVYAAGVYIVEPDHSSSAGWDTIMPTLPDTLPNLNVVFVKYYIADFEPRDVFRLAVECFGCGPANFGIINSIYYLSDGSKEPTGLSYNIETRFGDPFINYADVSFSPPLLIGDTTPTFGLFLESTPISGNSVNGVGVTRIATTYELFGEGTGGDVCYEIFNLIQDLKCFTTFGGESSGDFFTRIIDLMNSDSDFIDNGITVMSSGNQIQFLTDAVVEQQIIDSGFTSAVPIPAAAWLLSSGLLGLIGITRHKNAA